jgi:hypothetical protein
MEFIGIFFPAPMEEAFALRWARRLGVLLGPKAAELRPETTLGELLDWAAERRVASLDFTVVFEPELRRQMKIFLRDPDAFTFRDMVTWTASWYYEREHEHG